MSDVKLSTAIRGGARLRPQSSRAYYEDGKTCALGGAAEFIGYDFTGYDFIEHAMTVSNQLKATFDVLANPVDVCPGEDCKVDLDDWEEYDLLDDKVFGIVSHLNDDHKWTREAIANWLESIGY